MAAIDNSCFHMVFFSCNRIRAGPTRGGADKGGTDNATELIITGSRLPRK